MYHDSCFYIQHNADCIAQDFGNLVGFRRPLRIAAELKAENRPPAQWFSWLLLPLIGGSVKKPDGIFQHPGQADAKICTGLILART
jgi:hypothetical protein